LREIKKQFQVKWAPVHRPELREIKDPTIVQEMPEKRNKSGNRVEMGSDPENDRTGG